MKWECVFVYRNVLYGPDSGQQSQGHPDQWVVVVIEADLRHRISAEWRSASPQNEACGQLANAEVHLSTQVPWSQHCLRDLHTHMHSEYIYIDNHIVILSQIFVCEL